MRDLQKTLDAAAADVTLVSISVDPGYDTPEVLKAYAAAHGAAPGWLFVTGERGAIQSLLKDGFHVAFADDGPPSGPLTHSDRFVLVDGDMKIRGYYHGSDPDDLARLADDARHLAPARSG
jgi:protein SCO1/2